MHELHRITLENEFDLILAHKRSMKLGELAGLTLSAQTTFATAVSELARWALEKGKISCMLLFVDNSPPNSYLVASVTNDEPVAENKLGGLEYAKRLVSKYQLSQKGKEAKIELFYAIPGAPKIDLQKINEWRITFRNEKPISPYDELKRKNEQLQELSEKILKSEQQYRTLTNTLPQLIVTLDSSGYITYANEWLEAFTGKTPEELNREVWQDVVHPDDYTVFSILLSNNLPSAVFPIKMQCRLRNCIDNEYIWHLVSVIPLKNESQQISSWIGYMVDIHAQKIIEQTLQDNKALKEAQQLLEAKHRELEATNRQLNRSNHELQQFAYIASHDLQEPVRKVLYYADYVLSQYSEHIDEKGALYLSNIHAASARMRTLIQDLLRFSQVSSGEINFDVVNLDSVAQSAVQALQMRLEEKNGRVSIGSLPEIMGEKSLLEQLFENIIGNAIKYSREETPPVIDVYAKEENGTIKIFFDDNGIGFEDKYVPKMFELFQRLHSRKEYQGNGIGLAICKKITELHHGSITALPRQAHGARFIVTFPISANNK